MKTRQLFAAQPRRPGQSGAKIGAYPIEFKLMVIQEAKRTTNRNAARVHGVNERSIRLWRSQEAELIHTRDLESTLTKPRYRMKGIRK